MNAEQNARIQMMAAVIATSDAHTPAWANFGPYATPYAAFKLRYADMPGILARQETTSVGTTAGKKALRVQVEAGTDQIGKALVLYGKLHDDAQLSGDAYMPPSRLSTMGEKALIGHATKIISLFAGLPTGALTEMNISGTFVGQVASTVGDYTAALGTPRHKVAEAAQGTGDLALIIEELMDMLEDKMDPAIDVLEFMQAGFCGEYRTVREIVDAGTSTRELSVVVSSEETGVTLAGAQALITPGNIEKQTGPSGTFYINNMEEGDYQMTVNAAGYSQKAMSFHITDGQATVVNVKMTGGGQSFPGS